MGIWIAGFDPGSLVALEVASSISVMELVGGSELTRFGAINVFGGCAGSCKEESPYEIGAPDAASGL